MEVESSSEDSFAWTNASSDTDDEEIMVEERSMKNDPEKLEHDNIKTTKKKSKAKSKERKTKEEPSGSENDIDAVEKKYNSKEYILTNGMYKDSKDSALFENNFYLNVRVKEEKSISETPTPEKPKNKSKHVKEPELNEPNSDNMSYVKQESDAKKSSKSKKNKLKKNSTIQYNDMIIEDKFSAEETIVQAPSNKRKEESNSKIKEEVLGNENKKTKKKTNKSYTSIDESISQFESDFLTKEIPSSTFANSIHQIVESDSSGEDSKSANKEATKSSKSCKIESIKKASKRTVRISDRIRFEDETSQDTYKLSEKADFDNEEEYRNHHDNNTLKSSQFVNFLKDNPNLKLISSKLQKKPLITENDEVWVLQYPEEINVKSLQDINLTLDSKCKVKICGQTYEGNTDEKAHNITLITMEGNKFIVNQTTINGFIKFNKRVHKARSSEADVILNDKTSFMLMPDIKGRHSLFTDAYKEATSVIDRLDFSISESQLPVTEKKKKKHRMDCNETEEPSFADEHNHVIKHEHEDISPSKKKKKKRKQTEDDEDIAPKKKRLKRDPDTADAWDSEKAIEENLFNF